ncbi:helix-turn-helix transcriptional regulator [Paenibacillus spongiae]|uniref:AraC family transcriptional regulator n=1 Tax=Paenibacillus spongiae TaxID=2909671 RepID=A0ABY5S805_9BACL|nr:AraC family transcriptional regulator [Paenibacillus spongiae]UVI28962.1 AraC family transcriptional regulator [Paenibacillus spongiae]
MDTRLRAEAIPPFVISGADSGSVVYPPGGTFGPRVQQHLQLVMLHTGSMIVKIDDIKHTVPPGHVALLLPGHLEHFTFDEKQETWHRWIDVMTEPLSEEAQQYFEGLPTFIPLSNRMNQLTDLMLAVQKTDDSDIYGSVKEALGRSAILLFLTECIHMSGERRKHPAVMIAKEEIHQRYGESINLKMISSMTNNTPEHLIRLFRRDEGMTPTQYLWRYRLSQGLDLLRGTGLTIGEIAYQVGFKTSYHFSRTIKLYTGKTPSEIRKESWSSL